MKISELKQGQQADVEVSVIEISEPREFNKYGKNMKVATATVEDDSGSIKMSLWNQDVDNVKVGEKIKLTNGYVNEFQGEKQLTTGKFGKIEVIGEADKSVHKHAKKAEPEVEKAKEEVIESDDEVEEEEFGEEEF